MSPLPQLLSARKEEISLPSFISCRFSDTTGKWWREIYRQNLILKYIITITLAPSNPVPSAFLVFLFTPFQKEKDLTFPLGQDDKFPCLGVWILTGLTISKSGAAFFSPSP